MIKGMTVMQNLAMNYPFYIHFKICKMVGNLVLAFNEDSKILLRESYYHRWRSLTETSACLPIYLENILFFLGRQATTDTSQSTQCSRGMHATSTVLNTPNLLELHWPPQEFCCSLLCLVYLVAHQSSSTLHRANFFPFHIFYIIHEKSWSLTTAK